VSTAVPPRGPARVAHSTRGKEATLSTPTPAAPTPTGLASLIPVWARLVLSLITGAASVLNVTTFGFGGSAAIYLSGGLAFFAYIGIPPVTGEAFQNVLLKLFPASWVQTIHGILGGVILIVTGLVTQAHWSTAVTAAAVGVITELGALGFGPTGTGPVTAPATVPLLLHN
jgi:hypothetical protein